MIQTMTQHSKQTCKIKTIDKYYIRKYNEKDLKKWVICDP